MKKIVVLLALVTLALAGCRGTAVETEEAVVETEEIVATVEVGKIYYWLATNNSNPFYVPGLAGWHAAADELGVEARFVGPEEPNLAEQIKTLEEIAANPNTGGVLFYAMDFNAGEPLVKEAESKGISIVYANTDSPFKTRSGFIGTNSAIMGMQAASFVAELVGCEGSVGTIGNNSVVVPMRMEAFRSHIEELCPDVVVEEAGLFDGSVQAGMETLDAYMVAHPDLTLLWWADGAAGQMVEPWNEKIDAGLETMFLGTDMPPVALQAVKNGDWVGTVGQDTFAEEYWGLQFLVARQNGLAIPDTTLLSTMIITKDNVDEWLAE